MCLCSLCRAGQQYFVLKGNRNNKTFLQRLRCILCMGYYTSFNHQLLQNAVLYPKNGVRSVNLAIPAKTSKLMSYGSRGVDASDTTIGLSNFSANQR